MGTHRDPQPIGLASSSAERPGCRSWPMRLRKVVDTSALDDSAGRQVEGAEGVHDLLAGIFAPFPDWHAEPELLHRPTMLSSWKSGWPAPEQGEFAGIPPSGRRMDVRLACLFEFEGVG